MQKRELLFQDAERLEDLSALLVFGGIALEALVAISPLSSAMTKIGNFLTDLAVASGVYGEIRFGRVVGDVLKAKLAGAIDRATELEKQLAARTITKNSLIFCKT